MASDAREQTSRAGGPLRSAPLPAGGSHRRARLRQRLREGLEWRSGLGRRGAAPEESYLPRRRRGATWFTSRQEHDGLTIVVERYPMRPGGPADGLDDPPVFVLVHGLGVSSRYFQPLAAELARRGEVLVVDLPGYGMSPGPGRAVGLEDHARVLGQMVAELGLRDPVLVGHSMGAQIVTLLAAEQPEITDRVVLLAPTMESRRRGLPTATRVMLMDALREPPRVVAIALTDYIVRCGLPYLFRQIPLMLVDRIEERMPAVAARVLVICGDRDAVVSRAWGRLLSERLSDGEYHEVSGAHVVMHTDPVTVARHIEEHARR